MEYSNQYKWVNSKSILSSAKYQRDVNQTRIIRMLAEFDQTLVNPPKLSFRDGKYFVFDGQHTIALLKARNNGLDLPVLCKVYEGMTEEEEAVYFEKQFGIFSAPSTTQKFFSAYNRGEPTIVDIVRIAEAAGFVINFSKGYTHNGIRALRSLYNIYTKFSPAIYMTTLGIIKATWLGEPDSLRREILEGVAIFCHTYEGRYNRMLFIKKLSKITPIKIIREAQISTASGTKKYAQRILSEYNKNLTSSRLDDEM